MTNNEIPTSASVAQLIELGETSRVQFKRDLEKLRGEGVICRVGSDKSGYWEVIKQ